MSIAGILSSSFLQNQLSGVSNPYQKQIQKLGQDLQSGNLSAAQSDFASLQQSFSQSTTATSTTSGTSAATATSPIVQAFNQLATDLQSGNLSAAQGDLATVKKDFQTQGTPAFNHFHHHSGGGSQGTTLLNLLGAGSASTSTSGATASASSSAAQQAYAAFQQQVQQFALTGGSQAEDLEDAPSLSLIT